MNTEKGKLISGWFTIVLAVGCGLYACITSFGSHGAKIYLLITCTFIFNLGLRILTGRGIWKNTKAILSTNKK